MKLTIGQAVQIKQLRSNRGFPDIAIYEPRNGYNGLFIELKAEGTDIICKRATDNYGCPKYISDHVREQADCLTELRLRGYAASFAIGFDEAKKLIDNYLK